MVLYPNKLPESERVCFGICNFRGLRVFKGNSKENKYFIAYFTLILHKTKPSACLGKNQDPCRRFCISEPENQSL